MQNRAVQFTKKPYLPLFSSETADKFASDYTIEKNFCHALHLVAAHLHRQNQVAHALRTRDLWLASLSMHFPIHFTRRAHEYPVTLRLWDTRARAVRNVERRTLNRIPMQIVDIIGQSYVLDIGIYLHTKYCSKWINSSCTYRRLTILFPRIDATLE